LHIKTGSDIALGLIGLINGDRSFNGNRTTSSQFIALNSHDDPNTEK
jgi:hypothetical protein